MQPKKRQPEPKRRARPTKPREKATVINIHDAVAHGVTTALARRRDVPVVDAQTIAAQPFAHGNTQSIFSTAQQDILHTPARDAELDVRPDNGAVYMPHVHIRRRLSAAFGVGGWRLLPSPGPMGAPQKQAQNRKAENIYQSWQLWIGNYAQPVAEAIGFARYYSNNPSMDYGDAIEAAKSNALMRCAKSLDIGNLLEWDKFEQKKFRDRMCCVVMVPRRDGKWRAQWRRIDADPFEGERAPKAGERVQFTRDAPDEHEGYQGPTARTPPGPSHALDGGKAAVGKAPAPSGKAAALAPPQNPNEPQVFVELKERSEFMWAKTKHAHGESVYIVNEPERDAQILTLIERGTPCAVSWVPGTTRAGTFVITTIEPLQ